MATISANVTSAEDWQKMVDLAVSKFGGLDTVVFCGGIGENSVRVRRDVCTGMDWLGISLDAAANDRGTGVISTGPVSVRVIPTDEERVIARAVNSRL